MKRIILIMLAAMTLNACAQNKMQQMADDPEVEPQLASDAIQTKSIELDSFKTADEQTNSQILTAKYSHLDPQRIVPTKLLATAVGFYDLNLQKFANKNYLTIIDYSKSSTQRRMYVVDMRTGGVWSLHVAHGKGSDPDHDGFATYFSNTSGSQKTSLGFYRTAETYSGNHGLSLRLDGLSSTNSNARERAIVVHGADYVQDAAVIQGRSWGCPAVPMSQRTKLIEMIKNGSLIFSGLSGQ